MLKAWFSVSDIQGYQLHCCRKTWALKDKMSPPDSAIPAHANSASLAGYFAQTFGPHVDTQALVGGYNTKWSRWNWNPERLHAYNCKVLQDPWPI